MTGTVNLFSTMESELSTAPSLPRYRSPSRLSGYKYWLGHLLGIRRQVREQIAIASSLE
ncbi:hypothetical protein BT96DRAFT_926489, partial [Gymnopus androsaceus JB14]